MTNENKFSKLKKLFDYLESVGIKLSKENKDSSYFKEAIIHPTFDLKTNYKKLAFRGDGVIRLVITRYICSDDDASLKDMSIKRDLLTRNKFFAKLIKEDLKFDDILLIDEKVKNKLIPNSKVYANLFEAIIGAVDKCLGYEQAKQIIYACILSKYGDLNSINVNTVTTPKKDKNKNKSYGFRLFKFHIKGIKYKEIKEGNNFKTEIYIKNELIASGVGVSKKISKEAAAKEVYEWYSNNLKNN